MKKKLAIQLRCGEPIASATAPTTTSGSTVCGSVSENVTLSLSCPSGMTISSIPKASYGTPSGACGSWAQGSCHAANSLNVLKTACIGKANCSVVASNSVFGGDPCFNTKKKLMADAYCTSSTTTTSSPSPTAPTSPTTSSPAPTTSGDYPLPSGAKLLQSFNIANAIPIVEAYSEYYAPRPWIVDHCGKYSPQGDSSNTKLRQIVADGTRWTPLYSPGSTFSYARSEVGLDTRLFAAGKTFMIEWVGVFPNQLPPYEGQPRFNAIMQVHNNNGSSPYYQFYGNTSTKKIEVGAPGGAVAVADYSTFYNQRKNVRFTYKVSSGSDGFAKVEIDGKVVFQRSGPTTPTPGMDYVKFGIYDWGRALVDPAKGYRGRSFEQITERFRVYQIGL